jgi:multidrug efflux pump subunit AcrA (membrane-fusion protein)
MTDGLPARRSRRRVALLVVGLSLGSAAVGVVGGRQLRSPADAAAARRPPEPTPIRVPVERRVLARVVTGRGDVAFTDAVAVTSSAVDAVVTEPPPAPGTVVGEGDVVLEVGERPVIVLGGAVPMYRDLAPGTTGVDVRQLEESLVRLGYDPGPADGSMDATTGAAVAALFRDRGHRLREPDPSATAGLDAARAQVAQLEEQGGGAALAGARAEVRAAAAALAAARARGAAAIAQADADVAAVEVAHRRAETAVGEADRRLAAARGGQHPDTAAPPTAEELRDLEQAAAVAADAAAVATGAVAPAHAARTAVAAEQQAAVEAAAGALDTAEARLREVRGRSGDAALADARRALARAEAEAGPSVRRGELVFVPALPAAVTVVHVELGDRAEGVLAELSGAHLGLAVEVPEAEAAAVEAGLPAEVAATDPDLRVDATVLRTESSDAPGTVVVHLALTDPAALALRGRNVRARIPLDRTPAPVLAVPVAAVAGRPDGSTWVEVERGGRVVDTDVSVGLTADGWVEVEPERPGALDAGDLVTVGRRRDEGPPARPR